MTGAAAKRCQLVIYIQSMCTVLVICFFMFFERKKNQKKKKRKKGTVHFLKLKFLQFAYCNIFFIFLSTVHTV